MKPILFGFRGDYQGVAALPAALGVALLAFLALFCFVPFFVRNSRAATATPSYELLRKEGRFELRKYPDLTLATTPMQPQRGMNGAFGSLFRFITGENAQKEKISMTTPVLLSPDPSRGTMSFILPPAMDPRSAPAPTSTEVIIQRVKGGEFAVYRYSGRWSEQRARQAGNTLKAWVEKQGIALTGEEIVAYYDPPWTPPFLRRNEILMRVK